MERNYFGKYAADLKRLGAEATGTLELEIARRGRNLLQYIPFEHVNRRAKLVIVGITPGPNQLALAYGEAQRLLRAGRPESEILVEVKKVGAFGSPTMRPNLLKMLRHFSFAKLLGIENVESLWGQNADLLHSTSVVPHAAFTITPSGNRMFSGSFDEVMKAELLRECFMDCFVPSIAEIGQNALYVGLGPCPQAAMQWCVDKGYLRMEQLLGAFCHPSTTGGSTTRYYLREVTRGELNPNNPVLNRCDWLDHAYRQMKTSIASLLGEESLPRAVAKLTPSAVETTAPIDSAAPPTTSSLGKVKGRAPVTPSGADIAAIMSELARAGFTPTNETKKLAELRSPGGQTIYVVKTSSQGNQINLMVHPSLNPETMRLLDGVDSVSNEHRFHSNMTRFPKRLNRGKTETAYGWQVGITTFGGLPRFLAAFRTVSF